MSVQSSLTIISVGLLLAPVSSHAKGKCPAAVTEAIQKSQPDATVESCKKEKEHGKTQYEVKLTTKDSKKLEFDVSPEGSILQTEEKVDVSAVPAAVTSAFAAKYPSTKATKAEKQTKADGAVTYELGFKANGKKRHATFAEDGKFLEKE